MKKQEMWVWIIIDTLLLSGIYFANYFLDAAFREKWASYAGMVVIFWALSIISIWSFTGRIFAQEDKE